MVCIRAWINGHFMVMSAVKPRKLTGITARATAIRAVDFMAILDWFSYYFGRIFCANSIPMSADISPSRGFGAGFLYRTVLARARVCGTELFGEASFLVTLKLSAASSC